VTAAQRQAGDARRRDDPEGDGLTEGLGRVIDVASRAARAHSHRLLLGVDPHALHRRQVDDQSVIDAGETRTIMAAAANGDREPAVPAEVHRRVSHNGPLAEGEKAVDAVLAALPKPIIDWAQPMPYTVIQTLFDPLLPKGLQWYWKGDFVNGAAAEQFSVWRA
jgi:hypothetical protein